MKLTHIAAAVCATFTCGLAAAVTPHNTLPVTGTEMYFSGSTASDPLFKAFMAKNCDSNTLDAYRADTSLGMTQYLYVCSSSGGFGGSTGPKGYIIVHKSGTSSSDGVVPVANQTTLAYLSQTDAANAYTAGKFTTQTSVPATSVLGAYNFYQSGVGTITDTAAVVPDVGVSDVEPKFFTTSSVYGKLTSVNDYLLIFGVMATKTMRNDLQTIQGLTSGSDTIANIPSLTKSDLSAILTGKITNLSSFGGPDAAINIGRRSSGSGTTKTFDITFANNACGGSVPLKPAGSTAGSGACTATGASVVQMGTSEDMEACLNNWNTAGVAAIGEISTDYQPATSDGWRFIKVDGFAPEQINTTEGRYPLWAEGTLNTNTANAPSGAKASILATVIAEAGNPTTLSALNSGLTQPLEGYNAGFLVLNTNAAANAQLTTFPLTASEVLATPVSLVGHGGDSCAFPTEIEGTDPLGGPNGYTPQ
jgi:hypothetical protein